MLIGIDFDNTIACYDDGFLAVAKAMALVPPSFQGAKKAVRDHVRQGPGGDMAWQRLQARLYGPDIGQAHLMPGMGRLLERLNEARVPVVIISHKTRSSPLDPNVDLRQAALGWMEANGLFDHYGLSRDRIYFESTRAKKIDRIKALGCTQFIDDLDEVFDDPSFPQSVQAYLYNPHEAARPGPFTMFSSHTDIADRLLGADPVPAATRLLGKPPIAVEITQTGGNNRLYRVQSETGSFLLKCYPSPDSDPRQRLTTEWTALTFLANTTEQSVPRPIQVDPAKGAALYEWIDGTRVSTPNAPQIDQALEFLSRLHGYRSLPGADTIPKASEACLSEAELLRQIDMRVYRLEGIDDIAALITEVKRVRASFGSGDQGSLDRSYRTLSPSDFGFHNALVSTQGHVTFVDFEYFGWDDPVKLVADTLLHPGFVLLPDLRSRFAMGARKIYGADGNFDRRLRALLPLYVLRWTLILLNEFLPERLSRRIAAGQTDIESIRARQLAKAKTMFSQFSTIAKEVP